MDQQIAEEQLEASESQRDQLKEQVANLEVELGVLKEEQGKLARDPVRTSTGGDGISIPERLETGDASTIDRSSVAFIQMEKQNNRLKEALARSAAPTPPTPRPEG